MGDDAGEKEFEASQAKLQNLRNQGQVPKSQDLSTGLSLVVMLAVLFILSPIIWHEMTIIFVQIFEQLPNTTIEKIGWQYLAWIVVRGMIIVLGPFLLIAMFVGILFQIVQVGPLFTTKPLGPNFGKLNPVPGFKNLVNKDKIVDLLKNIIKIGILGYLGYIVYMEFLPKLLVLGATENIFSILGIMGEMMTKFAILAAIAFFAIGAFDFLYQKQKFLKQQKMTLKEVKDEFKNQEGDPHVKAQLRQKRMQMLQQSMLEAVPTADVVTTNPIHIAVALKYNADMMDAPRLVAKGAGLFAERIKSVAREHGVPIVENPVIARTLYRTVDVDQEVPPDLYQAVAEILLFAWKLKGKPVPSALAPENTTPGGEPPPSQ